MVDPAPAVAARVEALLARPARDRFALAPLPPPGRDPPPTPRRASPLAELRALSVSNPDPNFEPLTNSEPLTLTLT